MILNKETAQKTAELLLQINAIKLQPQNPFTWASGWKSPIYCDNRITLSYPVIRNYLKENLAKQVEILYGKPDVIAGVATGAIGIGALVADVLGLPFCYVRPEAKALEEANLNVKGMLAIFTYGFDVSEENFKKNNVELHTLSDYDHLLQQAEKSNYISSKEKTLLSTWRMDPANWTPQLK